MVDALKSEYEDLKDESGMIDTASPQWGDLKASGLCHALCTCSMLYVNVGHMHAYSTKCTCMQACVWVDQRKMCPEMYVDAAQATDTNMLTYVCW